MSNVHQGHIVGRVPDQSRLHQYIAVPSDTQSPWLPHQGIERLENCAVLPVPQTEVTLITLPQIPLAKTSL